MKLTIVVVPAMLQAYEYYYSVYQVLRDVPVSILLLNTGNYIMYLYFME